MYRSAPAAGWMARRARVTRQTAGVGERGPTARGRSGSCAFCDVVGGLAVAHVVAQTPEVIAFLDRAPLFKGHVLVAPRDHVATLPDLPDAAIRPLFEVVRDVARVMPAALGGDGSFVAVNNVVSQSVPHLHVHVVPRRRKDGLRGFFWPRQRYLDADEAEAFASLLRTALR